MHTLSNAVYRVATYRTCTILTWQYFKKKKKSTKCDPCHVFFISTPLYNRSISSAVTPQNIIYWRKQTVQEIQVSIHLSAAKRAKENELFILQDGAKLLRLHFRNGPFHQLQILKGINHEKSPVMHCNAKNINKEGSDLKTNNILDPNALTSHLSTLSTIKTSYTLNFYSVDFLSCQDTEFL